MNPEVGVITPEGPHCRQLPGIVKDTARVIIVATCLCALAAGAACQNNFQRPPARLVPLAAASAEEATPSCRKLDSLAVS